MITQESVWVSGDCSVSVSPQPLRVPVSYSAASQTRSVQLPLGSLPSKSLSEPSGRNLPVKGAEPAVMEVAASSSKMVLM